MTTAKHTFSINGKSYTPDSWKSEITMLLLRRENALIDKTLIEDQIDKLAKGSQQTRFASIEDYLAFRIDEQQRNDTYKTLKQRHATLTNLINEIEAAIINMMPHDVWINVHDPDIEPSGTYFVHVQSNNAVGMRPTLTVEFEDDDFIHESEDQHEGN